ncbi:MAG: aminoacyl-tRNA hydrolase [Candidatus Wolfebacteria bacterium]|nr:aminoacyl-tRNA hydrolase [Candidatus Wolfebacteria bacterium]
MEFKGSRVRVILGIGNPGEEYEHTYHNAGLLFVQFFLRSVPKGSFKEREGADVSLYTRPDTFSFALSRVYMNQSGSAAGEALRLLKARPEELTLVHDDTDIPLGSYKFAFGRGSAGHHGVQSVASSLQTKDFWRLRIGVRADSSSPARPSPKAKDIVLRRMPKVKERILENTFLSIARLHGFPLL